MTWGILLANYRFPSERGIVLDRSAECDRDRLLRIMVNLHLAQ